jgi:hypothetical protein
MRTTWNLFHRVAADLLYRLPFILRSLLPARHALFGAALKRCDFVNVLVERALLALGFVS